MIKPILTSTIILFICTIIESSILSNLSFLPAIPDLLLICVVYFSLTKGKTTGEITGFISGLFLDFISGAPLGLNCLLRTIIGFISGHFNIIINIEGFFVAAIAGFVSTLLKALLILFISIFFPTVVNTYELSATVFISELVLNTILTPFIFKILGLFKSLQTNLQGMQSNEK